jgi:hypothetical protein
MTLENDDLEELGKEIRRLIESNKAFLDRVGDEGYEDTEEDGEQPDPGAELDDDDYEEL